MTASETQRAWEAVPWLLVAALLLVPVEGAPAAVQALVLLALAAAGWSIGCFLARHALEEFPASERAFAAAAFGLAVAVVLGVAIGHFGVLTGWWFRGTVAVTLVALTALRSRGVERAISARPVQVRGSSGASPRQALRLRAPRRWRRWKRAVLWAAMLLVLAVFLRTAIRHRYAPPGHFSYDDTSYHLTTVATWSVHHDLRMPRFTFGDPRTSFYPFASELLSWELTTPFGGGDFAARWVELPFALLTLFGLALVARRLGAGETALLAPLLYATVSETLPAMALTAGNDHALAFAAVVTVHGALLLRERPRPAVGVYAGTGLGLLLATKYLAVIYAPLLVLLTTWAAVVPRRRGEPRRRRVAALLAVAAVALVVGGYAYLRNAVTTGNPIFPVSLRLAGWSLPGWAEVAPGEWGKHTDSAIDAWRFPWVNADRFGELFRFTMLPAGLMAPFAALVLAPRRRRALYACLFLVPLGVYLLFVRLVEDHRGVRYLLPGLAVAAVAAAWLLSRLPPRARAVAAVAVAALAAAPWVTDRPQVLLLLPPALGVGWVLARRRPVERRRRPALRFAVALGCALALAWLAPSTMRKYEQHRYDNARAAGAFERLTGRRPARVAYTGWNQPYLFSGRRLQNALYMPPVAPTLDTMFYRWRGAVEEPGSTRPRRDWQRNLDRLGVDWVVWVMAGREVRPERGWMMRSPRFSCVYTDGKVEIWKVRR